MTMAELGAACDAADVPWGPINSIADIFEDPQFAARGNLLRICSTSARASWCCRRRCRA